MSDAEYDPKTCELAHSKINRRIDELVVVHAHQKEITELEDSYRKESVDKGLSFHAKALKVGEGRFDTMNKAIQKLQSQEKRRLRIQIAVLIVLVAMYSTDCPDHLKSILDDTQPLNKLLTTFKLLKGLIL